ncbi:hypothetical protein [Paenibacillus spongiae]|uniref:Uncharacterized protein n=1 Tax=Paenibacillus spongiae TaxID=2909671 RepID=A0ABY5SK98_9BACL|nr:hypothetical protein [Paenibacillus spongiae]UVI33100.1 hypothetical protein L1F29_15205 [Paenibacillus spongiae]
MHNPFLIIVFALFIVSVIVNWNKQDGASCKVIFVCTACLTIALIVLYIMPFKFSLIEQTFLYHFVKATMNFMKG